MNKKEHKSNKKGLENTHTKGTRKDTKARKEQEKNGRAQKGEERIEKHKGARKDRKSTKGTEKD